MKVSKVSVEGLNHLLQMVKRVKQFDPVYDDLLPKVVNTINELNALPRGSVIFNGEPLDRFVVPEILEPLILPESVTLRQNQEDADFLLRPDRTMTDEVLSSYQMTEWGSIVFAGLRKEHKFITLTQYRKPHQLAIDKIYRYSYNGKTTGRINEEFPIPLNLGLLKPYSYTMDEWDHLVEYFLRNYN